jgi:hypothetical protein
MLVGAIVGFNLSGAVAASEGGAVVAFPGALAAMAIDARLGRNRRSIPPSLHWGYL